MKTGLIVIAAVVAMYALTACEQASSPASVDKNVAEARASAAKEDNKALKDEAKTVASADVDVANSHEDALVTEAKGRHDIAIQRCDGLAGDQQKACKDQADAALDLAKANAKAQKAAIKNGVSP
jgi:hypothetical protein